MKIIKSFGVFFLYLIVMVITSIFTQNYSEGVQIITPSIIISVILVTLFYKDIVHSFKTINLDMLKKGLKIWLIGYLLMVVSNLLLVPLFDAIAVNEEANRSLLDIAPIASIFTMALLAPITEELVFRTNFKSFKNKYVYIIVSALLFGYMHVIGETGLALLFIIPYAFLGAAFAYMRYETNNDLVPIIFHILHNSLAIAVIFASGAI